ncbi:hypothetical protein M569_00954 [Genlisea aurea]|uniref:Root phototropism protein 2 n=1 Tax=Genlisea aurea TaxID=192259 RepID=S8EM95_9LAMI|nr:hypothetical protein M569_00954 [Genlisea aurea]
MADDRLSHAMERTGQWVLSQQIPTDVVVAVGTARFSLHKFTLIAKSNLLRTLILESEELSDPTTIDLSEIPGGSEIFERAAKFCYGVNFEITVNNVAALRCAAEYLQMTDGTLGGRTEDFLSKVALTSLSAAVTVLKTCEDLLPIAEDLKIVQRCVEVVSAKACVEANFPSRTPANWWTEEMTVLGVPFFKRIITTMKTRGAKGQTLASAIITYTERSLRELVRHQVGSAAAVSSDSGNNSAIRDRQREILEAIVSILPPEKSVFHINFLCCLLRTAIFLRAELKCKSELEKRISAILEDVTVEDLLLLSYSYDGEKLFDLGSVRRILSAFVEKEKSVSVFNAGDFSEVCSAAMQKMAKIVDAYLGEIAIYEELGISRFKELAKLVPETARKVDDDLYRAIDIYLKAHPDLDEIEREKVCAAMDPLKLSYEARVHASQNKRLPVQIVLHALYYDQLQLRSGGGGDYEKPNAASTRFQAQADTDLVKENEKLRTELLKMKMYVQEIQESKNQGTTSSKAAKKPTFFSSMSKTLGKLNPFRIGSKDTLQIDDAASDVRKPRRRRFSIS